VNDGDIIQIGSIELKVWSTPGHADSQLAFQMNDLLFSGDNIYRDGGVGAIDAHHGSDIPSFIQSLQRIRDSEVKWLLPSHGPYFRKDAAMIDKTLQRLDSYLHLSDFGTCAIDWPLIEQWEQEIAEGNLPS
jgi:glyoxylase-like metal-dependent hydrolase (beta-lactamase superfamily II)